MEWIWILSYGIGVIPFLFVLLKERADTPKNKRCSLIFCVFLALFWLPLFLTTAMAISWLALLSEIVKIDDKGKNELD